MDDESGREVATGREDSLSGGKAGRQDRAPQLPACRKDGRPARAMDGPIHASTAEKGAVRGVHDDVDVWRVISPEMARTMPSKSCASKCGDEPPGRGQC